jgi:tRNA pseudouridine55 synthase
VNRKAQDESVSRKAQDESASRKAQDESVSRKVQDDNVSLNGWLILDKPLGLSSAQGVAAVKRIMRGIGVRPDRIGHGGTLDPLATGVLPIAIGEATKLAGRMLDATKGYVFTVRFGTQTSTGDAEGEVTTRSDARPIASKIASALEAFRGEIDQVPPVYSAIKVDGKRAYARSRAGETVELPSRRITIFQLSEAYDLRPARVEGGYPPLPEPLPVPGFEGAYYFKSARPMFDALRAAHCGKHEEVFEATFSVSCSKGTYIRSLARDIALALGTVGHVSMLRRTKAGPFTLEQAIALDKFESLVQGAALEQVILPLMAGLDDIPALAVDPDEAAALRQGRRLFGHPAKPGTYLACLGSVPVALVEIDLSEVRVLRGFNL